MQPWYIATETFTPKSGEAWQKYVDWSGLTQLQEVVSLDGMLCPRVLGEVKADYWPHIVNEDYLLDYFVDLDFLRSEVRATGADECNLLCVYLNPPTAPDVPAAFELLGYDLVDTMGSASALTNCGGFDDVFDGAELSPKGLLTSHARALEVQAELRRRYPDEIHADCHVWAIAREVARVATAGGAVT
jgi:hypothetical protein